MKKITFENKLASLNINSNYIISSIDVNEIKNVVNSFSDCLLEQKEFDKLKYRYIFINLPKNINKKYDVEIETSNDNWINDVNSLKLSENSNLFFVFNNGIFQNLENSYISNLESGKTIVINIESIIHDLGKCTCRFRFKDIINNVYTNYYSNDLNINTKIKRCNFKEPDYKFFTISDLKYKNHIVNLLNLGFDLNLILNSINYVFDEKTEIKLYSFIYDGENIIDVTSLTTYSSNDSNILINNSTIERFTTEVFKRFVINSSIEYENKNFTNKCNICINPITLCEIEGTFLSNNSVNNSYVVEFYAKYSNQTKINIANDSNFSLSIRNGNFLYNNETHVLTPIKENSIDEITISYIDHDYASESLEKKYILKIKGVELYNIVGKINNENLSSIDNKTNYSVSAFYSDNTIKDVTNDENLEIVIFNNKNEDHNTLAINKENAEISTNDVLYNDEKYISFSFFDERSNKIATTLNKINLINSSFFSIFGKIITSDGNNIYLTSFNSELKSLDEAKLNFTNQDLSNVKNVPELIKSDISFNSNENEYNLDNFTNKNKNCYYQADIYLNSAINNNLLIKTVYLPGTFNFNKNKYYEIKFKTLSKINNVKFIENIEIDINKNFDENYIIGFKNVKIPIIGDDKNSYNIMDLIKLVGVFESSINYEFEKTFIYDEIHDAWLIKTVPFKTNKLKKLKMSFAYLNDNNGYSWSSWNLKSEE